MIRFPRTRLRSQKRVHAEIDALLKGFRSNAKVALHLGCGNDLIPGMINCDRFNPCADRGLDCTRLDGFEDSTVDLIESHHMVEHLSMDESRLAFAEWSRVLRGGGLLVLTCPDIDAICGQWRQLSSADLGYAMKMLYGSQENPGMFHRSGYTRELILKLLNANGFRLLFWYSPYPIRPTPSQLVIAHRVR